MKQGILLMALVLAGCNPEAQGGAVAQGRESPLPDCEWCGTAEAPKQLSWRTTIAGPDEPGDPLVISGTVYQPDGRTPAPDVVLYAYHTNNEGIYPKRGGETGNARRHGYLRGWLRTNERGQYEITTIRPASYPTRTEPAHIHVTLQPPGQEEYWIDSVLFEGDPLLQEDDRKGSGVVPLSRDERGRWIGRRDIVLRP
jgi:protocatechuate 3,4-dioxygenase beta subunit